MKNKKLSLRKIAITRLNNLDTIKGGLRFTGPPSFDGPCLATRPTTKTKDGTFFTEEG